MMTVSVCCAIVTEADSPWVCVLVCEFRGLKPDDLRGPAGLSSRSIYHNLLNAPISPQLLPTPPQVGGQWPGSLVFTISLVRRVQMRFQNSPDFAAGGELK